MKSKEEMGKTIKAPTLSQIEEDEVDEEYRKMLEKADVYAGELSDFIEQMISNRPKKSTSIYKKWYKDVNALIDKFNKSFGRIYNRVA